MLSANRDNRDQVKGVNNRTKPILHIKLAIGAP